MTALRKSLIAGACGVAFAVALSWSIHRPGPYGEKVPSADPDEDNRFYHPYGFSIVVPQHWEVQRGPDDVPHAWMYPRESVPSRGWSGIAVVLHDRPPDLSNTTELDFSNARAFEEMRVAKDRHSENGPLSLYNLYIQRNQAWWHVSFYINEELTELPDQVRRYVDTLRWVDA